MNPYFIVLQFAFLMVYGMYTHHQSHNTKEREKDGVYSPRDRDHLIDGIHDESFDHEAILGSHKEAEDYDKLPPEEAKRRLEKLLSRIDLNADRLISRSELKAWILRSFVMLSEEEARDRLEDADENQDGNVTWPEYLTYSYGMEDGDEIDDADENNQMIADDKSMWKTCDLDEDNVLNFEEWVVFTHPEEHPKMLPLILEQTLRDKDKDQDGVINFQEYLGERADEQDKEWLVEEKSKFDRVYDKDQDGVLNSSEILSWVVPSNEEIADEEVEHLFAATDDDHDNLLTYDEVLDHHDIFVGSEVTDFGEHLRNLHFDDEL